MQKGFLLDFMWAERFLLEMEQFHDFWEYRPVLSVNIKNYLRKLLIHSCKIFSTFDENAHLFNIRSKYIDIFKTLYLG